MVWTTPTTVGPALTLVTVSKWDTELKDNLIYLYESHRIPQVTGGDFTASNTTTFADVPGLVFTVGASEVWAFVYHIFWTGLSDGEMKIQFTTDNAPITIDYGAIGYAAEPSYDPVVEFAGQQETSGVNLYSQVGGIIVADTDSIVVQLQMAQRASSVNSTTIYDRSFGVVTRKHA